MEHQLTDTQLERIIANLDRLVAAGRVLPDEAMQLREASDDDARSAAAARISDRHRAEAARRKAAGSDRP